MKSRWLIFLILPVLLILLGWAFWQRPQKVEMSRLVPAETLVYFEANDLPLAFDSLTDTSAWRSLAPRYGITTDYGSFGWLSEFLADTNLGSTKTVVFGRAQAAIALVGLKTDVAGEALQIKPRYAVVVETNASNSRARDFVEISVADFARRQFGDLRVEKLEKAQNDRANWTIFSAAKDERKLFAAVSGSTAILGNDETAVKSCLEVKNGKRASLAENERLQQMRQKTEAENALAFGFVAGEGVKTMAEVGAVFFAGQLSEEPAAMSLIAQSLPPMIEKTVTAIGWSAHAASGKIEDRYFMATPQDLTARLREPLAANGGASHNFAEFLPADARSITVYNLKNPGAAWRALVLAFSARLDVLGAAAFSQVAGQVLEPYGIKNANAFLSTAENPLVTARLGINEKSQIALARVSDPKTIKTALEPQASHQFLENFILLGEQENLDKCLAAKKENRNLGQTEFWREAAALNPAATESLAKTVSLDEDSAHEFIQLFADEKAGNKALSQTEKSENWATVITETRLLEGGFERRTQSAFGLIGTLAVSFGGAENSNP